MCYFLLTRYVTPTSWPYLFKLSDCSPDELCLIQKAILLQPPIYKMFKIELGGSAPFQNLELVGGRGVGWRLKLIQLPPPPSYMYYCSYIDVMQISCSISILFLSLVVDSKVFSFCCHQLWSFSAMIQIICQSQMVWLFIQLSI